MHEIIRMVEVLPAPLGPRKPNDSPLAMLKSTPSTATKSPKRLTSPCASTMGDAIAPGVGAPVPVDPESGTSVIGEECDVIVRERYRAAHWPTAGGPVGYRPKFGIVEVGRGTFARPAGIAAANALHD